MDPIPSVQAILICEKIIEEARTRTKSLINIFNRINTLNVPIGIKLALYARLTDAEGAYEFRINVVQLSDDRKIAQIVSRPLQIADRLLSFELAIQFPMPIQFEAFGKYEFQLYANDVFLGHTTILVNKIEGPPDVKS
jgi:hypothetical protein